ncbi:MAG: permease [Rickettsiales bacterium]|nr:permease [Rickettsiales bacterium]
MLEYFTKLADYTTYNLLGLENGTKIADATHFFVEDTTKIFFLTAFIIFIMGLFKRSLSQEKVRDYLSGKPKWVGYALAVVLGWITPFCSCSSIPLFVGFLKAGIPLSITITFLAVSPMPIESIAILGSLIGFAPSMVYMILCGISGVIFGIMTDKFGWEKYVNEIVKDKKPSCSCGKNKTEEQEKDTLKNRIHDAIVDVKDVLSQIWLWILLGITLGAFMHGFIPQELFYEFATKYKFLSVPFAVLMGLPLYANATGVIPIMQALYMKGVPLGTVLTFMMSITALSIPQLIILRKILKKEMLIRFAGFLAIAFTIIGLIFNMII